MAMRGLILLLCVVVHSGSAQITASSDLNCDFETACRWRNGTTGHEDGGDWFLSDGVQMDSFHGITSLSGDAFAYTQAFGGRQRALLISEVVSCQLGGATLKYWYWKTESNAELDVCIRQPPGNPDPAALRCYNALSSTHGQSWIPRNLELPPISQPFELIFRGTFAAPLEIIGLDSIVYDAILCREDHERGKRSRRSSVPLIGLRDWQLLQSSPNALAHQPTMLVVSQTPVDHFLLSTEIDNLSARSSTATSLMTTGDSTTTMLATSTTEQVSPTTTTEEVTTVEPTTTTTEELATNPPDELSVTAVVKLSPQDTTTLSPEDHAQNMIKLLRGVAPILPFVPALVRTLQSVDPRVQAATGRDPLQELASIANVAGVDLMPLAAAAHPSQFPQLNQQAGTPTLSLSSSQQQQHVDNLALIAKKFGLLDSSEGGDYGPESVGATEMTTASSFITESPTEPPNMFGIGRMRSVDAIDESTIYPPRLVQAFTYKPRVDPKFVAPPSKLPAQLSIDGDDEPLDLSSLSEDELRKLEDIHRKIFQHQTNRPKPKKAPERSLPEEKKKPADLIIYEKKNRQGTPGVTQAKSNPGRGRSLEEKFGDLAKVLPADSLKDLQALREIPNLEELTEGMDLTLLNRPGGFSLLKQQFIERLLRRNMGLPPLASRPPLPPPIVPVKVTRKMLRNRVLKARRRARH